MTKPPNITYELSDAEKRDLVQLIQQSNTQSEKYHFMCLILTRNAIYLPPSGPLHRA